MENLKNKSKEELIQIIEYLQKKEKLKDSSGKDTDNLLASMKDLVFVFDKNQRYKSVNLPNDSKLFVPVENFIGKINSEVMPIDINNKFVKAFEQNKNGKSSEFTYNLNINDKIHTFSARLSPLYENEKFNGVIAVISDITKLQQTYDVLKKSETLLKEAAQVANLGYWELDLVQNKLIWSEEVYRMFEVDPNKFEATYESFLEKIHPDDREMVNSAYTDSLKNKTNYSIEHRLLMKNGSIKYVYEHCKTNFDKSGNPLRSIGTVQDISEFKESVNKLHKSEEKYRILAENTYDWEYWISSEGHYKYLSPACERITGYSPKEFIENPDLLFDIVHPDFKEKVHRHYHDENNKNTPVYSCHFPIISKNGKRHWINHNCSPVFDEHGKFIGRRGNNRDVSDIKLAEFKLKKQNEEYEALNEEYKITNEDLRVAINNTEKNERLFRGIFNTVSDPMSISTILTGKYLRINKGFIELTGYTPDETIGKTVEDINLWENIAERDVFIEKLKKDGYVHNFEADFRMKDGRILPGLVSAQKIEIDKVPHLLVITRDISKIKEAQNELIQSEEKFRNLFNKSADAIYIHPFSEEGFANFIDVNDVACKMLGYTKEEFKNLSALTINIPKDAAEKGSKEARQKFEKNGFSVFETEHLTKNGKKIPVEIRSLIIDLAGQKTIMSIVRDISEIKKAQLELSQSEEKFRKAFYTNPDSVNINRLSDGTYVDVNKGFTDIMGYAEEDVIGKTSLELTIWKRKEDRQKLVEELKIKGIAEHIEAEFLTKKGEVKVGLMSAIIIKLNREDCILSITKDITERKKNEKELQKYREHLEELVQERTDELETSLEEQKTLNEELNEANQELERLNDLFIGREFRIKELRDKVKELEEQLNKPK